MADTTSLDAEVMRRVKEGDVEAFADIVRRHQTGLLNFFRFMGASPVDAEDMAQETFWRLYQWRTRYRPTAKFTAFLLTLARHVRADALRKARCSPAVEGDEKAADRLPHPVTVNGQTALRLDAQKALAALPETMREVVVLSIYHNLRYEEIGDMLGIPVGTVKSRMFHAMRRLRDLLAEWEK